jgi:hypothetical protein
MLPVLENFRARKGCSGGERWRGPKASKQNGLEIGKLTHMWKAFRRLMLSNVDQICSISPVGPTSKTAWAKSRRINGKLTAALDRIGDVLAATEDSGRHFISTFALSTDVASIRTASAKAGVRGARDLVDWELEKSNGESAGSATRSVVFATILLTLAAPWTVS